MRPCRRGYGRAVRAAAPARPPSHGRYVRGDLGLPRRRARGRPVTVTAEPEQVVRPRRRWWRLGVVAAGAVLAAFALHGRLPGWPDVWAAIYRASLAWI